MKKRKKEKKNMSKENEGKKKLNKIAKRSPRWLIVRRLWSDITRISLPRTSMSASRGSAVDLCSPLISPLFIILLFKRAQRDRKWIIEEAACTTITCQKANGKPSQTQHITDRTKLPNMVLSEIRLYGPRPLMLSFDTPAFITPNLSSPVRVIGVGTSHYSRSSR